jgi:hypothetical protein
MLNSRNLKPSARCRKNHDVLSDTSVPCRNCARATIPLVTFVIVIALRLGEPRERRAQADAPEVEVSPSGGNIRKPELDRAEGELLIVHRGPSVLQQCETCAAVHSHG